ncbi:hypothetical protein IAI52_27950 [Pseudomonas lurida]|uniref:hypothetical protein n=1 Tax=Pseudomonas lurida TaxID=244566 RepID=UPI001656E1DB|nr:hypothetical protein [Pseudomonas lurida]MBC8984085.1 hypothetical protein [Pseudomonas lurida]
MPTINIDQIKPASDAVQAAHKAWTDAGAHEGWLRNNKPSDVVARIKAEEATGNARERYEQALIALAATTHLVIARAGSE